ncbi:RNA polymerase sigma factor [Planctomycetota bacterium]
MDKLIKGLCKSIKKGDKTAACELLKIYHADIFAYLRRLCPSREDAEDLTQQTFLKALVSLDGFRARSKFSTWLYRIAHNTYIDWRRKHKGNQSLPEKWWQECISENQGPFDTTADRQTAKRLYEAVDKLDENKKHVVHLHYYQGLSLRETAKVLNISTSTVKYRLREVIKILRNEIDVEQNTINQKQTIPIAKGEPI